MTEDYGLRAPSALIDLRVLDLSEFIGGSYAARLIADLGAEVVKVEMGQGDPLRRHGPFAESSTTTTGGLFHILNTGKTGWTLTADTVREKLEGVFPGADVVILSAGTDTGDALWERRNELRRLYPHLIVARLSAAGPEWRAAARADCSLHVAALSGVSAAIGEADAPPLVPPYDVIDYIVGANLAGAILAAAIERRSSAQGQLVEVDASEVSMQITMTPRIWALLSGTDEYSRSGRRSPGTMGGIFPWGIYQCRDGLVALAGHAKRNWDILLSILDHPAWARNEKYSDPAIIAQHYMDEVDVLLEQSLARFDRAELFERARNAGYTLGPVTTIDELLEHTHLAERRSLSTIKFEGREVTFVKAPYILERSPIREVSSPAPDLGSCFTPPKWSDRTGRPSGQSSASRKGPLAGKRVIDFSWNWAAPMVGAAMADLGAEVIRVEHRNRLDNARIRKRVEIDGKPVEGPIEEVSFYFHQVNRGKLGVDLDLKDPDGVAKIRALIESADLVIENFTPGVFDRAGLHFEDLSNANPKLIWLSMSSAGQFGPLAGIRTYAPIMSALSGFDGLVGYEGCDPCGSMGWAAGDPNGGCHGLVAALAALYSADRDGRGQRIDLSLIECLMAPLAEAMAEASLSGANPKIRGSRHPMLVPHGNFPCRDGGWVAVSVRHADEWSALEELIGPIELIPSTDLGTLEQRRDNRGAIESALAAWTVGYARDEVVARLLDAGVPATPVRAVSEIAGAIPQAMIQTVDHPIVGPEKVLPMPWKFSETPVVVQRSAPLIGQHNETVMKSLSQFERI